MFKRFSIHVALIFLFAFAQIGVVTHEISHVEDLVKHGQQDANKPDPSKQHKNTHGEQCEQCISFAKITGGLLTQSFEFAITQADLIGDTPLSTQASSQSHTAYAARAPPSLS